jgi:hypothetical protein
MLPLGSSVEAFSLLLLFNQASTAPYYYAIYEINIYSY